MATMEQYLGTQSGEPHGDTCCVYLGNLFGGKEADLFDPRLLTGLHPQQVAAYFPQPTGVEGHYRYRLDRVYRPHPAITPASARLPGKAGCRGMTLAFKWGRRQQVSDMIPF
jgi:hypothetical protein